MDISSAVQWWEEWQLRILVLGSLFVQTFIYCFGRVRTLSFLTPVMKVLRVLGWLAYIGGDALAIYALATLFNRHNQHQLQHQHQHQQKWRSHTLEVLWAPILLIHLGGQPMTAYSLEDNELWMRYTMTIVSQVTIACYVLYKQWPGSGGESRLLHAAVLLFVFGILKFVQKPWALMSASFQRLLASTTSTRTKPSSSPRAWRSWRWWTSFVWELRTEGGDEEEGARYSLQEYVQAAKVNYAAAEDTPPTSDVSIIEPNYDLEEGTTAPDVSGMESRLAHHANYICKMFVDLPIPYLGRLKELRSFHRLIVRGELVAYRRLQQYLNDTYYLLYTRWRSKASPLGTCLTWLLPFLSLAAAVLFSKSRKDGYNGDDVRVTYVLLYCTAVQEIMYIVIARARSPCLEPYGYGHDNWSSMVYQHNLISFCARKKQPPMEMKLAVLVDCLRDYINKHWYISHVPGALPITRLVCQHVTNDGWRDFVCDPASYRRFSNFRGQQAVRRRQQHHQLRRRLGWSLGGVRFDQSVLLWHIATDLCFHHQSNTIIDAPAPGQGDADADADATRPMRSREISNYMIYLLFIRPKMLMPGTRPNLFTDASHEIELILKDSEAPQQSSNTIEGWLAREIMGKAMQSDAAAGTTTCTTETKGLIGQACMLAEALMTELDDDKERWKLIEGVWVEMLCYSASRCNGYLHARTLGQGGEYLSYVWLLWFLMGMETLADRHQRPEPPQHEDGDDEAWASTSRGRAHQSAVIPMVRHQRLEPPQHEDDDDDDSGSRVRPHQSEEIDMV